MCVPRNNVTERIRFNNRARKNKPRTKNRDDYYSSSFLRCSVVATYGRSTVECSKWRIKVAAAALTGGRSAYAEKKKKKKERTERERPSENGWASEIRDKTTETETAGDTGRATETERLRVRDGTATNRNVLRKTPRRPLSASRAGLPSPPSPATAWPRPNDDVTDNDERRDVLYFSRYRYQSVWSAAVRPNRLFRNSILLSALSIPRPPRHRLARTAEPQPYSREITQ